MKKLFLFGALAMVFFLSACDEDFGEVDKKGNATEKVGKKGKKGKTTEEKEMEAALEAGFKAGVKAAEESGGDLNKMSANIEKELSKGINFGE